MSQTTIPNIDDIWQRIVGCAGQTFTQIRGRQFTFQIAGGHVIPDTTNQQIPKSNFEEALTIVPLKDTTSIQHLRGPSYIFAILMDSRIRGSDW